MTTYRTKPVTVQAALYDGELVGEGVQTGDKAEWKVQPQTCPDWFPGIAEVVHETPQALQNGQVVQVDDDLLIGAGGEVLVAKPGDWLVIYDRRLSVVPPDLFHALYERA